MKWPCMANNNVSVQYNDGGLLPDIILLTQGYYGNHRGTRLMLCRGFVFAAYETVFILSLTCLIMYYIVVVSVFAWCPCMAINVVISAQYNGGLLPDITLFTQCYYHHRGTRLNAIKRFRLCSL